jgi:peptidoglycan hydrolase-like protein with peptidoglycan-binding domain
MLRNFALATTLLGCAAGVGTLAAQTSAPTKPAPQAHSTPTTAAAQTKTGPTNPKWTAAQITEAQTGLAKAGYYRGKPTGTMNSATRKALKAFEKANNMRADGRLSDSVLAKLKSA